MKTVPYRRRPAAQHTKRVKDQGALWRQAERIDDRKRLGENATETGIDSEPAS